jgi:DNA-binding response OmpR family regulator
MILFGWHARHIALKDLISHPVFTAVGVVVARILLIEDNDQQRELYATLLYYNGFDVEQAGNAESGMAAAKQRHPDLIMIDYRLPGVDGLYVAKLLKDSPTTADVPIICFSEFDIPVSALRSARVDGYMRKPLYGDTLVRGIRSLIGWDESKRTLPAATRKAVIIAGKESTTAEALAASLRLEQFQVSRAADGATGLGTIAVTSPNLVVVDLNAPVLDGWSIFKRLRGDSSICHIPVFAFSDDSTTEEEQRALDAGFAAYLRNVDRESVATEIERHVKRGKPT